MIQNFKILNWKLLHLYWWIFLLVVIPKCTWNFGSSYLSSGLNHENQYNDPMCTNSADRHKIRIPEDFLLFSCFTVSPIILHIVCIKLSVVFRISVCSFSAGTKLLTTGIFWCKRKSRDSRQDNMRWGIVPPATVSFPPTVSMKTPTSPMGPHCIAKPAIRYRHL